MVDQNGELLMKSLGNRHVKELEAISVNSMYINSTFIKLRARVISKGAGAFLQQRLYMDPWCYERDTQARSQHGHTCLLHKVYHTIDMYPIQSFPTSHKEFHIIFPQVTS